MEGSGRAAVLPGVTTIATVCRFKPVHLGHAAMLRELARRADRLVVGIGSPNRYDARNPFTAAETADMLRLVLPPGDVTLLEVPDLGHGPRWRAQAQRLLGAVDLFVTANAYVASLLAGVYPLAHPRDLVATREHVPIDGARVRRAMALGHDWAALVPGAVADYLRRSELPERFRREFGLATLAEALAPAPASAPR